MAEIVFTEAELTTEEILSDSDKIDYLFQVAKKVDKLVSDLGPQVLPMLESIGSNPMLKMFMR